MLSRFFGIETPIDSSKGAKEFKSLAQDLLDANQPGDHNQAVMELGALVCSPKSPKCDECPISENCYAYLAKKTSSFPVKQGKIKIRKRHFNYLVLESSDRFTRIKKRTARDIWRHLYEFPLLETTGEVTETEVLEKHIVREFDLSGDYSIKKFNSETVIQKPEVKMQLLVRKLVNYGF